LAESPTVGVNKVLLTGGEPLLFDGLVELTAYVASMGISTDLNSTLWLLTPAFAERLAKAGLTEASVSIAGTEDIHDRLHRRPGAWSRLLAGIELLREVGLPVDGSMYVTPENLSAVPSTIEQAAQMGLASFTVSRALPVGHGMGPSAPQVSDEALAKLHHNLAGARAGGYGISVRCVGLLGTPNAADCGQGRSLIGILADGSLTSCVLTRDSVIGLPKPLDVGLARAVEAVRAGFSSISSVFCYGGSPA